MTWLPVSNVTWQPCIFGFFYDFLRLISYNNISARLQTCTRTPSTESNHIVCSVRLCILNCSTCYARANVSRTLLHLETIGYSLTRNSV